MENKPEEDRTGPEKLNCIFGACSGVYLVLMSNTAGEQPKLTSNCGKHLAWKVKLVAIIFHLCASKEIYVFILSMKDAFYCFI